LRQQDLADLFGVSRMPVREALRQLEAQALLNVVAHKGAVVAPLVQGDAAETYALRILLESEALRLSIPLLEDEDLAQASRYIDELETERTTPKSVDSIACSICRSTARPPIAGC
jgi:DNA-binding GntR family transcriptional regulator